MKITMSQLTKDYKKQRVINNLNLKIDFEENNILGILGPNGSGKSTILRLLAGVLLNTDGAISIENQSDDYAKWAKQHAVYVSSGERGLMSKLNIVDNAVYFGVLKGISKEQVLDNLYRLVEEFNFSELVNKKFDTMSTGQRKKAQLLCALSFGMELILLDEPSNGLDLDSQKELETIIQAIGKRENTQIVISSHDINLLSDSCNQYIYIREGELIKSINTKKSKTELIDMYNSYLKVGEG